MTNEQIKLLAEKLIADFGLADKFDFKFKRLRRFLGQCKHPTTEKRGVIVLSSCYLSNRDITSIEDTIRHEIAHALVGPGHGHNNTWRKACLLTGAQPNSCSEGVLAIAGDYQAICPKCSYLYNWYGKPKSTIGYYCKYCGQKGLVPFKVRNSS